MLLSVISIFNFISMWNIKGIVEGTVQGVPEGGIKGLEKEYENLKWKLEQFEIVSVSSYSNYIKNDVVCFTRDGEVLKGKIDFIHGNMDINEEPLKIKFGYSITVYKSKDDWTWYYFIPQEDIVQCPCEKENVEK